jgi:hypothetical protein
MMIALKKNFHILYYINSISIFWLHLAASLNLQFNLHNFKDNHLLIKSLRNTKHLQQIGIKDNLITINLSNKYYNSSNNNLLVNNHLLLGITLVILMSIMFQKIIHFVVILYLHRNSRLKLNQ